MPTDIPKARTSFERAFSEFAAAFDRPGQLVAAAQVINSHYYEYINYAPMAPWVARIDTLLQQGASPPDAASDADLCTALIFAATWLGHVNEQTFTERAHRLLLDPSLEPNLKVSLGYALADLYAVGSRMADSRRIIERLVPALADPGVTALNRAYAYLQFGYHFLRAGEPVLAERSWQTVDRIAEEHGLQQTGFVARLFRSYLRSSQRDVAGAEAQLRGLEAEVTGDPPLSGALFHVGGVLLELARGDGAAAARHARLSLRHAMRLGGGFVNVAWRAHGSAALAMAGEHDDAERWIDEGLAQARGSWLECYQTNLLMSRAIHARPGANPPADWPWPVEVRTLGEFQVTLDDSPLTFARKAQKRPLSLLKALIAVGRRGVALRSLAESLYRQLMLCHRACGRLAEASAAYRRCRHMLSVVLGAKPSPETQRLFESLSAR